MSEADNKLEYLNADRASIVVRLSTVVGREGSPSTTRYMAPRQACDGVLYYLWSDRGACGRKVNKKKGKIELGSGGNKS